MNDKPKKTDDKCQEQQCELDEKELDKISGGVPAHIASVDLDKINDGHF